MFSCASFQVVPSALLFPLIMLLKWSRTSSHRLWSAAGSMLLLLPPDVDIAAVAVMLQGGRWACAVLARAKGKGK